MTAFAPPADPVTLVLNKVEGIRRSGSAGWMARCPAHEDRHASLSVTEGDDHRALVYCQAGCATEAVVEAMGLSMSDLFAHKVNLSLPRPPRLNGSHAPTLYAIRGTGGDPVAVHVRTDTPDGGKRMAWQLPDGSSGLDGTPTAQLPLFGSENLPKWDASRPILLTEGEKAAQALVEAGFHALGTVTGASSAPSVAVLQVLRDRHLIIWPDNDEPGRKHMHRVAERLAGIAASIRVLTWPEAGEHGDAADLLAAGSPAEVDALIAAATPITAPGPLLVRLSTVEREPLDALWPGHLYRGKLHLIEGDPGLGKSTATTDLAARISTGASMPDGSPATIGPAGVVILTAEDGLADTVRPRLEAARADLSRIVALTAIVDAEGERLPALPLDLAAVEAAIREVDAVLVIVDPLMAFLDSSVNSWRDQDVRRALAPLARLAERTGCAIVCIRHLNKGTGSHAMYRGGGSIGIIGAARVALLVAADPDDEERRVVATIKNNLAPHPPSLAFRLVADEAAGAARVEWLGESEHRASALLAMPSGDEERGALEEACGVLREILADGPVPASKAEREAHAAGVRGRTLDRARKVAGVRSERVGGLGSDGHWRWILDAKNANKSLRPPYLDGGALSGLAPLGEPDGELHHTCRGCQQPILDLADAFADVATSTFWHREHWSQRAEVTR